jgi:hypothetical protein
VRVALYGTRVDCYPGGLLVAHNVQLEQVLALMSTESVAMASVQVSIMVCCVLFVVVLWWEAYILVAFLFALVALHCLCGLRSCGSSRLV